MQKQDLITALNTWIHQQEKIGLNEETRITAFKTLRENYRRTQFTSSPGEEMKHLIKLLQEVNDDSWFDAPKNIKDSILERIKTIRIPLASEEKILHFFLTETNSTYRHTDINAWATAYPDYTIYIWTDDSFNLAVEISDTLQTKVGTELNDALVNYDYQFTKTLETLMLNKRRHSYTRILEAINIKTERFRSDTLYDHLRTHTLTPNQRRNIEQASLPDFLRMFAISQSKIDEIRAIELKNYLKTLISNEDEINRISRTSTHNANQLVSGLESHHRNDDAIIEHKKVTIDHALNTPYLDRLILTANRQQAIHTVCLSVLKEYGGIFINVDSKTENRFDQVKNLKLDPLLGAAYTKGLDIVIAKKGSLFINALFSREEKIKKVMEQFPDIQYGNTLSQVTLSSIDLRLKTEGLNISADEFTAYAYETLRNPSYNQITERLVGESGYHDVFVQQIQSAIGDTRSSFKKSPFLPLIAPYIKGITADTVAENADPGPSMIASKERFAFTSTINSHQSSTGYSRYTRQMVIQFTEDLAVNASAMALNRKNRAISSLYRYHEVAQNLITVDPGEVVKKHGEILRIILVGHASYLKRFFENNNKTIKDILLTHGLLVEHQTVAKVSVVACQFQEGAENTAVGTHLLGDGPAKKLFDDLSTVVNLEKMTVREGYVSVDNNGQKWISIKGDHTAAKLEERGYQSRLARSTDGRIEIYKEGGRLKYQRLPIEQSLSARTKVFHNDFKRFGLFSPIEINTRDEDGVIISEKAQRRLEGVVDIDIGKKLLANSSGNTVINAGPMALLAAMADGPHRVMVIDKDPYQIDALQKALIESKYHDNVNTWIEKIVLEETAKQQLKRVLSSFSEVNQKKYFAMMRTRVQQIAYDFFHADISSSSMANELLLHKGSSPITVIHLDIDAILIEKMVKKGRISKVTYNLSQETAQKQVKTNLATLTQSLRALCNDSTSSSMSTTTTAFSFYLYSVSDRQYKTLAKADIDTLSSQYIGLKGDDYDYVAKVQLLSSQGKILPTVFNWVRQSLKLLEADHAIRNLAQNQRKIAGGRTAAPLPTTWIPLLSAIDYDTTTKEFSVPYVDPNNPYKKEILKTRNTHFARAKQDLDRQNRLLNEYFELHDDKPRLKMQGTSTLGRLDVASMSTSSLFSILAIWGWVKNGITVEGNDGLAQALQVHTYVSMAEVAHSVTGDAITLGNFAQNKIQLGMKSTLAKGPIGSFSRGLRSFGGKIMWLGPVFDVVDITLSSTEYHLAKNEAQERIFRAEIIFGSISLGLSLGFIVASVLGATLLSAVLLPIGLLLAGMRYLVGTALVAAADALEKAKIIGNYFNQMKAGWENGGFKLEKGVLLPYQGAVIKTLNLQDPANAFVVFDPQGLKIIPTLHSPTPINSYPLHDQQKLKTAISLRNDAGKTRTMMLPMTTAATVTPAYSVINGDTVNTTADFAALRDFNSKQSHAFIVRDPFLDSGARGNPINITQNNTRVPTELTFSYQPTEVEILLGAYDYALIAPGITEDISLADSPYRQFHYHLKASPSGKAKIVLVLNRGQGAVKIDCTNKAVEWIIETSHLPDVELQDEKAGSDGRKLIFSYKKLQTNGTYLDEPIATIAISNRTHTPLRIQLERGAIALETTMQQDSRRYLARYALPAPTNRRAHSLTEVKTCVTDAQWYSGITRYLKIDNFMPDGSKNDNGFYLNEVDKIVYTQNTGYVQFCKAKLVFYNDKYVLYQGDVILIKGNERDNETLKQIFWITGLTANQPYRIYLPIVHLVDHQQEVTVASSMVQTQVLEKGILFKQQFTDMTGRQLFLTYLIDTTDTENKLYLLEVQGLSGTEMENLKSDSLNKLKTLMIDAIPEPLKFTSSLQENIAVISRLQLPQNTTIIAIGDRLIWPMPSSVKGITGTVTARIEASDFAKTDDYHFHLVGIVPGNKIEDHYYFWEATERNNYNQFYALYLQRGDQQAEKVELTNIQLAKNQIKDVSSAPQGVYLNTHDGVRYYLSSNVLKGGVLGTDGIRRLSARHPSINAEFIFCKEDKIYLGTANNQQGVWMLDSPITAEKTISYLPGENITPQMFTCDAVRGIDPLLNTAIPLFASVLANGEKGKLPRGEKIIEASVASSGNLNVITSSGLVLAIQVEQAPQGQPTFQLDLIGVTTRFTGTYQHDEDKIKTAFATLFSQLTLPEIIAMPFDNQTDWYQPKNQTLFVTGSHAPYLGGNNDKNRAYFSSTRNGHELLIRIESSRKTLSSGARIYSTDTRDIVQPGRYSRQGDVLILNADQITQPGYYLNIDGVSNLLIEMRQAASNTFIFEPKQFQYPVIGILLAYNRQLDCKLDDTPQAVSMMQQGQQLYLLIGNPAVKKQWLVISDAFTPSKTGLNKVKFSFQRHETDLQRLVSHYTKTIKEGTEANSEIAIPDSVLVSKNG